MIMIWSQPAARASSTPYWMMGLSTNGSISLGCALVAGRKRVPRPAAGNTALRTATAMRRMVAFNVMLDPAYVRAHVDDVRTGLRHRGLDPDTILVPFASLDARRKELIPEVEGLKREQNAS